MNFGNLNKRIQILTEVTVKDEFSEQTTTYEPAHTVRCRVIAKQTTNESKNGVYTTTELEITCRYSKAMVLVTPDAVILYEDQLYKIESIIDKYQTKVQLTIICSSQ